jgi:hypothetical protein
MPMAVPTGGAHEVLEAQLQGGVCLRNPCPGWFRASRAGAARPHTTVVALWRSYSSWAPFHAKLLIAPARDKPRTQSDNADDRSHTSEEAWTASLYRWKTDTENRHESSSIDEFSDGYGYDCFCIYCCCTAAAACCSARGQINPLYSNLYCP